MVISRNIRLNLAFLFGVVGFAVAALSWQFVGWIDDSLDGSKSVEFDVEVTQVHIGDDRCSLVFTPLVEMPAVARTHCITTAKCGLVISCKLAKDTDVHDVITMSANDTGIRPLSSAPDANMLQTRRKWSLAGVGLGLVMLVGGFGLGVHTIRRSKGSRGESEPPDPQDEDD